MMRITILFATCLSLKLLVSSTATANILSGFDTTPEGWTAEGGSLAHISSGGNPGGFLSLTDNANTYMAVLAPDELLGDWTQYLGGTLSFDARNLNASSPDLNTTPLFGTVTITGTGGTASRVLGGTGEPPADGRWHTYSATLDAGLWAGNLPGALAGVTEVRVVLESNNN